MALLANGPLAAPDPMSATTVDSGAVLAALGLRPPLPFPLLGTVDTEEVAALVRDGSPRWGLLYRTQAGPGPGLAVAALPPGQRLASYKAAISVVTRSPKAGAFMAFLRSPEARGHFKASGIEVAA